MGLSKWNARFWIFVLQASLLLGLICVDTMFFVFFLLRNYHLINVGPLAQGSVQYTVIVVAIDYKYDYHANNHWHCPGSCIVSMVSFPHIHPKTLINV